MADFNSLNYRLQTTFYPDRVVHWGYGGQSYEWKVVQTLGQGGQGTVFLEKRDTVYGTELRAVKKLSQQKMQATNENIQREIYALAAVGDHAELFVKFLGWYEHPLGQDIFLAMEYLAHGDLGEFIKKNGDTARREARNITRQLVTGVHILHQRNICHRDLKPQNILIASLIPIKIKLADFGVSKSSVGTELHTRLGTANYMAPELLGILPRALRQAPGVGYTNAVDMWALGCVVHTVISGEAPFREKVLESTISGISAGTDSYSTDTFLLSEFCKGNEEFPTDALESVGTSTQQIHFIKRLLIADPRCRASAAESLNDSWVAETATLNTPREEVDPRAGAWKKHPFEMCTREDLNTSNHAEFTSASTPNAGGYSPGRSRNNHIDYQDPNGYNLRNTRSKTPTTNPRRGSQRHQRWDIGDKEDMQGMWSLPASRVPTLDRGGQNPGYWIKEPKATRPQSPPERHDHLHQPVDDFEPLSVVDGGKMAETNAKVRRGVAGEDNAARWAEFYTPGFNLGRYIKERRVWEEAWEAEQVASEDNAARWAEFYTPGFNLGRYIKERRAWEEAWEAERVASEDDSARQAEFSTPDFNLGRY